MSGWQEESPIHEGALCRCGKQPVRRTVKKEGKNKGRKFYCCGEQQGSQCGTFTWEEEYLRTQPPAPAAPATNPEDIAAILASLVEVKQELAKVLRNQDTIMDATGVSPTTKRLNRGV